jgi:7-cyano-7-deazaguanine synthase
MRSAIVLLSGGLDSAVALWLAKRKWKVYALTVKYGNLNTNEVRSAKEVAAMAKVARHIIIDLRFLKQMSELRGKVKEPREGGRFPRTYIPSRNTIFLGIASHYAEIYGAGYIVTGHITRDPFPDSKPSYIRAINVALARGSWLGRKHRTKIITPLGRRDKVGIVRLALELEVPLSLTWSCHRNGKMPCGKCEGCISRSDALSKLKLTNGRAG